ncbi:haloacid dehalogenase, type II [Purpureocillium lavendulum]|uniref:Haloacid dehalogenase, type II n=1 Tax=Purpureocillium lavendulum TaxID=1247861 RepID=A0AB34FPP8_9HYPO|nr:haloacid dehalogenase, type II [Purpureocillium lavendulum]
MSPGTVSPLADVKGLTFDVFGTVVDWRGSITEELALRAHRKLASPDASLDAATRERVRALGSDGEGDGDGWGRFAEAWHASYGAFTRAFDPDRDEWKTIDQHTRDSLAALLQSWGLQGLYSEAEMDSLSLVWHRLRPWADSSDGLAQLNASGRVATATLSNGNVSLLRDLDDFGNLGFQRLLSGETFRAYKPNPATYLGAARELGLEPRQVAMVAAHLEDLEAARACGLRTVYVERPREEAWSPDDERRQRAPEWVDLWISEGEDGFVTLAQKLRELAP